jgi:hypothetical protein
VEKSLDAKSRTYPALGKTHVFGDSIVSRSKVSVPNHDGNSQPAEEQFQFGANASHEEAHSDEAGADTSPDPFDPAADTSPDPFDPAALRLTPELAATTGVKKVLLTIPVHKPHKSAFVRAHRDPAYRITAGTIELEEERGEIYLIAAPLWPEMAAEPAFKPRLLVTSITRQGGLFLWPLNLPRPDGRVDEWTRTGLEALRYATESWVRVYANMAVGGYEVAQATASLPEPEWPDLTLRQILRIAFRERLIESQDHPVLRRLRGEV